MGLFSGIGSFFGPVGSILGGIGDELLGRDDAEKTNQTAYAQQRELRQTAYQDTTKDLQAAGLNPMLAFSQGGASVPTGVSPTLTAPRPGDKGAGLAQTAKEIATMTPQIRNQNADTQVKHTTARLNDANVTLAQNNAQKVTANARESEANTKLVKQRLQTEKADTMAARSNAMAKAAELPVTQAHAKIDQSLAGTDAAISRISQAAGVIGNAFRAFTSGKATRESTIFNKNTGEILRETKWKRR